MYLVKRRGEQQWWGRNGRWDSRLSMAKGYKTMRGISDLFKRQGLGRGKAVVVTAEEPDREPVGFKF